MGKVVKTVAGVLTTVAGAVVTSVGFMTGNPLLIAAGIGLQVGGAAIMPKKSAPGINQASQDRLFATVNTGAPRTMVFGRTAMGTDVWYEAYTGTDKEYHHQIIVCAAHKVTSIEELWEDNELVWTVGGGVASSRSGYLTVTPVLEGNSGNMIDVDSVWNSANDRRLTGCAYLHVRRKRTGNSQKAESPYSSGVTNRIKIIGNGIPVYDPRKDSTVGGSGSQRFDDQTTWAFDVSSNGAGRNPALTELTYMAGWRIGGEVSVGAGVFADAIDFDSYIDGANLCDEAVTLAAGGTEKRYCYDNLHGDHETDVIAQMNLAMNAELDDDGGLFRLWVSHNDLADPEIAFTTDDIKGPFEWDPFLDAEDRRNIVRGRHTDASDEGLYGLTAPAEVKVASADGVDRVLTLDTAGVHSDSQHQRLMKQALQRHVYPETFSAPFSARAWAARRRMIVTLTFFPCGFVDRVFRVIGRGVPMDGLVPLRLIEENAAIHAWDAEESPAVVAATPDPFDPLSDPIVAGIGDAGTTANWSGIVDDDGHLPEDDADVTRSVGAGPFEITINYDHLGAALGGQLPRTETYRLLKNGVEQTSGITWTYTVLTGTVNGFNSASGPQSLSGSGAVDLTVTTLGSDQATVELTAVQGSLTSKVPVKLNKKYAAPPVDTGGSGTTTIASKSSGFSNVANTTFADKTGTMTGTVPAGRTAAAININWTLNPAVASPDGSWNVEAKVQREIASVWTDIGSTANSSPDPAVELESGIYSLLSTGTLQTTINDTGLSGATTYNWRVQAKLTSGSKTIYITGSVSITA